MSVYVMAGLDINDEVKYGDYASAALTSLVEHKVEVLAVSDAPVSLEGKSPYSRYVLLKFADQAAAQAWYDSAEYQAAIPLRLAHADTGFLVAVPGVD